MNFVSKAFFAPRANRFLAHIFCVLFTADGIVEALFLAILLDASTRRLDTRQTLAFLNSSNIVALLETKMPYYFARENETGLEELKTTEIRRFHLSGDNRSNLGIIIRRERTEAPRNASRARYVYHGIVCVEIKFTF